MLPKKINLGCGNVVLVKEVPRDVMQSAIGLDTEAAWSVDVEDGASHVGIIFVDASLPMYRKRFLLYHELVHAANDICYWEREKKE